MEDLTGVCVGGRGGGMGGGGCGGEALVLVRGRLPSHRLTVCPPLSTPHARMGLRLPNGLD